MTRAEERDQFLTLPILSSAKRFTLLSSSKMPIMHPNRSLRYKGKLIDIIPVGGLPATSAVKMHKDGRMEIMENYEEELAKEHSGWSYEAYKSLHSRSLSLHSCVGDDQAGRLAFYVRKIFPVDFDVLVHWSLLDRRMGRSPQSRPRPLELLAQHRQAGRYDSYSLSLVSLGSRLEGEKKTSPSNTPSSLADPPLMDVKLYLSTPGDKKDPVEVQLQGRHNGDIIFRDRFTEQKLRELAADGNLHPSIIFFAPRSYFTLSSIIDLHAKPTVPEGAEAVVATILRGESPPDVDWEITGSHDCECCNGEHPVPVYAVHKNKFDEYRSKIKATPGDAAVGLLEGFDDHALRLAIRIAYGLEAPLPGQGEYAKGAIDGLAQMFGDHFTSVVVPQWERAICSQTLALKKSDPSSMSELLYLLNIVWEAPYGLFPVAKRVAMGVMGDMAHLNISSSLQAWIQASVIPHIDESGIEVQHVTGVLDSLFKMMRNIPYVEKFALAAQGGVLDPAIQQEMENMKLTE